MLKHEFVPLDHFSELMNVDQKTRKLLSKHGVLHLRANKYLPIPQSYGRGMKADQHGCEAGGT